MELDACMKTEVATARFLADSGETHFSVEFVVTLSSQVNLLVHNSFSGVYKYPQERVRKRKNNKELGTVTTIDRQGNKTRIGTGRRMKDDVC
ncbi:expressed protein [Echinococcus multilocularis]|uniref:Expressed protein n=1 Tax=Echinococcus multilocularis TaxID=6211 RepID=A0A087VYQ5_ECHMU|nr:expressed protein [Echinococcus multilocularis]